MNNSRLPFTIAQSFGQIFREPRQVDTVVVDDHEVCIVCGALIIFAATIIGAYLGYFL